MASSARYHQWSYTVESDHSATVLPDGCRDILLIEQSDTEGAVFLTDWDDRARIVELKQGQAMTGFRLPPGLFVDARDLAALPGDFENVVNFINSIAAQRQDISDSIGVLATRGTTVKAAARQAGVSVRTLQRHFHQLGLPCPDYWRQLSRVRLAAQACSADTPLIDIADQYGFSDQAHMTREFVRWFGVTPSAMRHAPDLLSDVCQPGLGNWTSEQISIR